MSKKPAPRKSVSIGPSAKNLSVGQKFQFAATATDINDQPIPNPNFTWYLTGGRRLP